VFGVGIALVGGDVDVVSPCWSFLVGGDDDY
jgi:hypothetical protein